MTAKTDHLTDDERTKYGPVLKADEVAELLDVNVKTLYDAVNRGDIPGVRRIGRALRFSRDRLLQWLAEGRGPHP